MTPALRNLASGAAALALLFSGSAMAVEQPPAPPVAAQKPMHIMSMNLCTDLLLLQMVPRTRIASITDVAHDAVEVLFPGADKGVATNWATSEDIVNQKPDLILAIDYGTPRTRKLVTAALHVPLIQIKPANDFADIRAAIRQVGAAVGEPARAEALIRRMDARLAQIDRSPLPRRMRVVAWSGGDSVPGKDTLTNAIIEAAGAVNIAAQPGAQSSGFDIEQLLAARPDALLYGGDYAGKPSLHADEGQHRLVRLLYGDRRIDYDDVAHECGLPQSADSAWSIHRALLALPKRSPPL